MKAAALKSEYKVPVMNFLSIDYLRFLDNSQRRPGNVYMIDEVRHDCGFASNNRDVGHLSSNIEACSEILCHFCIRLAKGYIIHHCNWLRSSRYGIIYIHCYAINTYGVVSLRLFSNDCLGTHTVIVK